MGSGIRRIPKKYWKVYTDIEIQYVDRYNGGGYGFYYSKGEKRFICRNRGVNSPFAYVTYRPGSGKQKRVETCYRINGYYMDVYDLKCYYPDVQDLPEDQVDFIEPSDYIEPKQEKKEEEALKDFIYKVDETNKLKVESSYDSVDDFFEDDSDDAYFNHESIVILAVDTRMPLIRVEKAKVNDKKVYKFVVDITNTDGDTFNIKSVIDSKEKFNQLLQSTKDALNSYPQFSKYADDLENCL